MEFNFAYKDKQLAGDAKDVTCRNQKGICDRSTVSVRFFFLVNISLFISFLISFYLIYLEKQMRFSLPQFPISLT